MVGGGDVFDSNTFKGVHNIMSTGQNIGNNFKSSLTRSFKLDCLFLLFQKCFGFLSFLFLSSFDFSTHSPPLASPLFSLLCVCEY